jgi:hypothetical protein
VRWHGDGAGGQQRVAPRVSQRDDVGVTYKWNSIVEIIFFYPLD